MLLPSDLLKNPRIARAACLLAATLTASPGQAADFPDLHASCVQNHVTLQDLNAPHAGWTYSKSELTEWLPSRGGRLNGVVLMVHGLNLKPSRMDSLGAALQDSGFEVLRVALAGHRGSLDEMRNVTQEEWLGETYSSYCLALARARERNAPIFAVGYSLGALVIEDLMNVPTQDPMSFEAAVILAPAIAIHARSNLIRVLGILGRGFVVPSASPAEYRANPGTPMAAYESLFDLLGNLEKSRFSRSNIPTLVMMDPEDELVSVNGVQDRIREFSLTNWKFFPVSNAAGTLKRKFHHLIIDPDAVGEAQWNAMIDRIRRQLMAPTELFR